MVVVEEMVFFTASAEMLDIGVGTVTANDGLEAAVGADDELTTLDAVDATAAALGVAVIMFVATGFIVEGATTRTICPPLFLAKVKP